jgi:hypothetical protein
MYSPGGPGSDFICAQEFAVQVYGQCIYTRARRRGGHVGCMCIGSQLLSKVPYFLAADPRPVQPYPCLVVQPYLHVW